MPVTKSKFFQTIAKGLSQIMLQENILTGLLFLAGIFYGSITMGMAAIVATCCGTLTARFLKFDKAETEMGLYGFSPALVGVAVILFFEPNWIIWLIIVVGSVVAAIIQHTFIKRKIPVFTLPFVLVTWAILVVFQVVYPLAPPFTETPEIPASLDYSFLFRGFGQVIFQGSMVSGILFFIAVFIQSPVSAMYGLSGSAIAGLLAILILLPQDAIAMGLFSFNAVLCAIAFAGNKMKDIFWAFFSVILSLVISLAMYKYQLVQLTFPFVAATCCSLGLKHLVESSFVRPKLK